MLQPINGEKLVVAALGIAAIHECMCLAAKQPEHLITRVIYRWRARRPALVTVSVLYLAGHFLELWRHDPLSADTWHGLGF